MNIFICKLNLHAIWLFKRLIAFRLTSLFKKCLCIAGISLACSSVSFADDWFGSELSTDDTLYFYGSDITLNKARNAALVDLINQLSVSIKSQMQISVEKNNGAIVQNKVNADTVISTDTVDLPNVNWLKSDQAYGQHRVQGMLKVERLIEWLEAGFNAHEGKLNLLTNDTISLKYYLFIQKHSKTLNKAKRNLDLILSLCKENCAQQVKAKWLTQYQKIQAFPQSTCISIAPGLADDLVSILADITLENGFVDSPIADDQSCYELSAKLKKSYAKKQNNKMVKGTLSLMIKQGKKVISSNTLPIKGMSTISYKEALNAAYLNVFTDNENTISLLVK